MPSDISVYTDPGLPSAVVNWTEPTASDNSGSVTLTYDWPSGSAFPIGSTNVTYTATDAAGNQITSTFTVTVTGILMS